MVRVIKQTNYDSGKTISQKKFSIESKNKEEILAKLPQSTV